MNNILLLTLISTIAVLVIASIVVYQFYQQQQAIDNINKVLNPPKSDAQIQDCLKYSYNTPIDDCFN